ncbi:hypothetical protein [Halosimplex salinum]|uniref:hypothetical protein n=1 Tax=Halosimplex salinum TaxID=1710538 RepID=UPI000F4619A2|nr:hypothetical protein [Halosimplex salinum]
MSPTDENTDDAGSRWSLLGIGGLLSLCCLFVAPATTGVAGGVAAGGTTAALGGGLVQVVVTALTLGVIAAGHRVYRLRTGRRSRETPRSDH